MIMGSSSKLLYLDYYSAALGECAKDKDSLAVIHNLDGVRLVWSLLKNPSERVKIAIVRISLFRTA